jgi:hypothetical protein
MKNMCGILMLLFMSTSFTEQSKIAAINHGLHFDASLYGSVETIGRNAYTQVDVTAGCVLTKHAILSLESSVKYRNYSLVTTEFLTAAIGGNFRENEGRVGVGVGCQTYRVGGYRDIIPVGGVELLYIRYINSMVSLRIKERITLLGSKEKTLFTATLFGVGVSF